MKNKDKDAESRDKLDATRMPETAPAMANGPENDPADWLRIDWQQEEESVRRLRQRIFTASKAGDLKKVRNLQKLMLRSRANAQVSVRRVTELNSGRSTAGVDGKVVLLAPAKLEWASWAQRRSTSWDPLPVKRVYIPKINGKLRPLGIPVIADRILQAVVKNALEPEWEARFEPRSYGFRPGRGCHDAIEAIFAAGNGKNPRRKWVLDADLATAFDTIDHQRLLAQLGTFPARDRVQQWLKAGTVDKDWFTPTREGTPQGGVTSPLLLNIALHGMEQAAGVRYRMSGRSAGNVKNGSPVVVRYADDFVVLCESREQAEQIRVRLANWLEPRGLTFNEEKTRIVHLAEGFDFLGFTVRRYRDQKLVITPSKAAVKRVRKRLSDEMRSLRGANAEAVIVKLNPIIRGWTAYYRTVVSSDVFSKVDDHLWKLTYKWAKRRHPNKSKKWITSKYFGRFHSSRTDRWVFGDRVSGRFLDKFSWTKIQRHQIVTAGSSPDDPALTEYWAARRKKNAPPLISRSHLGLIKAQDGNCPICGTLLLWADHSPQSTDEWERWQRGIHVSIVKHAIVISGSSAPNTTRTRLIHASCHQQYSIGSRPRPTATTPKGLA